MTKAKEVEAAARELLESLERMHGREILSLNVREAYAELRRLLPPQVEPRDKVRAA